MQKNSEVSGVNDSIVSLLIVPPDERYRSSYDVHMNFCVM